MEDSLPAKVRSYHDEAFRFINEALCFDENGDTKKAFLLYNKGLRNLTLGGTLPCNGTDSSFDVARKLQEKMKLAKTQVEERIACLHETNSTDSCSSASSSQKHEPIHDTSSIAPSGMWEDVNELLVLERGVKMFFVSEHGNVTTLSEAQTLHAYQFIKYEEGCPHPPAFLQCSAWVFPMIPRRSPVLNTEPHTYMFPDIVINTNIPLPAQSKKAFASVGLILNPNIKETEKKRFERLLECYTDFNRYMPTPKVYQELACEEGSSSSTAISRHVSEGAGSSNKQTNEMILAIRSGDALINDQDQVTLSLGDKISMGIGVAAEMVAWGLVKGAEAGSQVVYQGGVKIRSSLKPNETPAEIDKNVQQNIRHVKSVAGVACQVSGTVVNAVAAMTKELAKAVAPVVVEKGGKMLPESVKRKTQDEKGQRAVEEAVKVAVGGAYGFAAVFEGLEKSWKLLYKSLQHATVQTVDYKYGSQAGEAANNSLGALGFALQTAWNVDNLGAKALAKRAAKDTGKQLINEAEHRYLPPAQNNSNK